MAIRAGEAALRDSGVRRLHLAPVPAHVGTSVVIPAHNEAESVGDVVKAVLAELTERDEVIVVDDGSTDGTAEVAEAAGARVVRRPYRFGNGSAIKAGVRASTGFQVVFLDADGQHDPAMLPELLHHLETHDMVVAARAPDSHASFGRRVANAVFNRLASRLTNRRIEDLTSGYRVMRRRLLDEFLPLLPNQFSYPTTITLASLKAGYTVHYVPIRARRRAGDEPSKIRPAKDGLHFLQIILKIVTLYSPLRVFGPLAAVPAAMGLAGIAAQLATGAATMAAGALLLTCGLFLFCLGLISEQIAALRFERSIFDASR